MKIAVSSGGYLAIKFRANSGNSSVQAVVRIVSEQVSSPRAKGHTNRNTSEPTKELPNDRGVLATLGPLVAPAPPLTQIQATKTRQSAKHQHRNDPLRWRRRGKNQLTSRPIRPVTPPRPSIREGPIVRRPQQHGVPVRLDRRAASLRTQPQSTPSGVIARITDERQLTVHQDRQLQGLGPRKRDRSRATAGHGQANKQRESDGHRDSPWRSIGHCGHCGHCGSTMYARFEASTVGGDL